MIAWNYQVETVQGFVSEFEAANPGVKVDVEFIPSAQYVAKVVLEEKAQTPFDVLYVFDNVLSQWASWLQPLDQLPGAQQLQSEMLPLARQSMIYDGKLYGLPYYTAYFGIIFNQKMADAAGLKQPPQTYAEWLDQARAVKQKGLSKSPLVWPVKYTGWGGIWVINTMVASRGGKLLDPNLEVTREGIASLTWWADTYKEGLSNPDDLSLDPNDSARAFMSGDYLSILTTNFFAGPQWANSQKSSKTAGTAALVSVPEGHTTVGFARMYSMNGGSTHKPEAWRLLQFLGGKDTHGRFVTPEHWVEQGTLTWGYKGIEAIPAVAASLRSWGADPANVAANLAAAVPMDQVVPFQAVWYAEWEQYANGVLQDVLGGRQTPEQGASLWSGRAKALAARYR
ncbi:MAG: extracellular solute-binding protein [Acidisphaera sp.]|nr:extracellular solute-binding protein [Acidisphaera sp.]